MTLTTLIVDDEPFVRQDLAGLLQCHRNIRVAGQAATVTEAKKQLSHRFFDIVFLDIRLRGGSGFDVVPFVDERSNIVFVTGYDDYAIRAFEVKALDYLLKPVAKDRLSDTLARVSAKKDNLGNRDLVFVKHDAGGRYVAYRDIAAVSSIGGNYLTLYLKCNETLLCRHTLKCWEDLLPESSFARVHKSTIINMDRVQSVRQAKGGSFLVRLSGQDHTFTASRRMAGRVRQFMEDTLSPRP